MAWITSMISGDTPDTNCIFEEPASINPTSSPAGMTATGLARANRAMVMPSNPRPTLTPASNRPSTPSVSTAPPKPASMPEIAITDMVMVRVLTPE